VCHEVRSTEGHCANIFFDVTEFARLLVLQRQSVVALRREASSARFRNPREKLSDHASEIVVRGHDAFFEGRARAPALPRIHAPAWLGEKCAALRCGVFVFNRAPFFEM
jgi:hypothetical protein